MVVSTTIVVFIFAIKTHNPLGQQLGKNEMIILDKT